MPASSSQTPQSETAFRPFGVGVSEVLYLIGLALLATGISLLWSVATAAIVCGGVLVFVGWFNRTIWARD